MIDKKLQIFDSGRGYPRNGYGGPTEWAQNWAAVQRAQGKRPSLRDFIEAAKATGWPSITIPYLDRQVHGAIPIEFLEWAFLEGGVYFVEIRGRVKIGSASNFAMRFKQIQSMSPDKILFALPISGKNNLATTTAVCCPVQRRAQLTKLVLGALHVGREQQVRCEPCCRRHYPHTSRRFIAYSNNIVLTGNGSSSRRHLGDSRNGQT